MFITRIWGITVVSGFWMSLYDVSFFLVNLGHYGFICHFPYCPKRSLPFVRAIFSYLYVLLTESLSCTWIWIFMKFCFTLVCHNSLGTLEQKCARDIFTVSISQYGTGKHSSRSRDISGAAALRYWNQLNLYIPSFLLWITCYILVCKSL